MVSVPGDRIAVTGGAGFIGSVLAEHLVDEAAVIVLDDLSTGYRENVPDRATLHEIDICEVREVDLDGVDCLFHLAANVAVERSIDDPLFDARSNVIGLLTVLEAARSAGVERVVFSSSSAVYGQPEDLPVGETDPCEPASPYAATKFLGEHYCRLYADLYGIDTTCLRYFNVYGPRQRGGRPYAGVIARFTERLLAGEPLTIHGDGEQTRDFVYVDDVARATLLAAANSDGTGRVYNVGTGGRTNILDIASTLEEITGAYPGRETVPAREGDVRHSLADVGRIESELDFSPRVDLEEGLARTVAWHQRRRRS